MWAMANIRLIKHEVIPDCESFEVATRMAGRRRAVPSAGTSPRWQRWGWPLVCLKAPVFADRAFHAIVCIFLKTCCDGEIHQCD